MKQLSGYLVAAAIGAALGAAAATAIQEKRRKSDRHDPRWGIMNSTGTQAFVEQNKRLYDCAVLDIANMGLHNERKGGSILDGELYNVLSIRHNEIVWIGRVKNGDEIAIFAPVGSLDRHLADLVAHLSGYGIETYQECAYAVRPTMALLDELSDRIDAKKPAKPVRVY